MRATRNAPRPTDPSVDVAALVPSQRKTETVYRQWPRNPKYWAGSDGTIIGPAQHVLKAHLSKRHGRLSVKVQKIDGGEHTVEAHIIIAETWHGARPDGMEVAHSNGVCTDNRPVNLRWATHLDNEADKRLHGTLPRGEAHYRTRLTTRDVLAIRAAYASGENQRTLAVRYGLTQSAISDIVRGKKWAHIKEGVVSVRRPGPRGEAHGKTRLTEDDVRAIRAAWERGDSQPTIAGRFGISKSSVNHIIYRRTWRHVQ